MLAMFIMKCPIICMIEHKFILLFYVSQLLLVRKRTHLSMPIVMTLSPELKASLSPVETIHLVPSSKNNTFTVMAYILN